MSAARAIKPELLNQLSAALSTRAARPPHPVIIQLGPLLRLLREQRRMSQDRLGELTSIGRGHLGRLEAGDVVPSLALLLAIADALEVPPPELVTIY